MVSGGKRNKKARVFDVSVENKNGEVLFIPKGLKPKPPQQMLPTLCSKRALGNASEHYDHEMLTKAITDPPSGK